MGTDVGGGTSEKNENYNQSIDISQKFAEFHCITKYFGILFALLKESDKIL